MDLEADETQGFKVRHSERDQGRPHSRRARNGAFEQQAQVIGRPSRPVVRHGETADDKLPARWRMRHRNSLEFAPLVWSNRTPSAWTSEGAVVFRRARGSGGMSKFPFDCGMTQCLLLGQA